MIYLERFFKDGEYQSKELLKFTNLVVKLAKVVSLREQKQEGCSNEKEVADALLKLDKVMLLNANFHDLVFVQDVLNTDGKNYNWGIKEYLNGLLEMGKKHRPICYAGDDCSLIYSFLCPNCLTKFNVNHASEDCNRFNGYCPNCFEDENIHRMGIQNILTKEERAEIFKKISYSRSIIITACIEGYGLYCSGTPQTAKLVRELISPELEDTKHIEETEEKRCLCLKCMNKQFDEIIERGKKELQEESDEDL